MLRSPWVRGLLVVAAWSACAGGFGQEPGAAQADPKTGWSNKTDLSQTITEGNSDIETRWRAGEE